MLSVKLNMFSHIILSQPQTGPTKMSNHNLNQLKEAGWKINIHFYSIHWYNEVPIHNAAEQKTTDQTWQPTVKIMETFLQLASITQGKQTLNVSWFQVSSGHSTSADLPSSFRFPTFITIYWIFLRTLWCDIWRWICFYIKGLCKVCICCHHTNIKIQWFKHMRIKNLIWKA